MDGVDRVQAWFVPDEQHDLVRCGQVVAGERELAARICVGDREVEIVHRVSGRAEIDGDPLVRADERRRVGDRERHRERRDVWQRRVPPRDTGVVDGDQGLRGETPCGERRVRRAEVGDVLDQLGGRGERLDRTDQAVSWDEERLRRVVRGEVLGRREAGPLGGETRVAGRDRQPPAGDRLDEVDARPVVGVRDAADVPEPRTHCRLGPGVHVDRDQPAGGGIDERESGPGQRELPRDAGTGVELRELRLLAYGDGDDRVRTGASVEVGDVRGPAGRVERNAHGMREALRQDARRTCRERQHEQLGARCDEQRRRLGPSRDGLRGRMSGCPGSDALDREGQSVGDGGHGVLLGWMWRDIRQRAPDKGF